MNLEQIALRVAKEMDEGMAADMPNELIAFARRLVAALGAQEPVKHEFQDKNGAWHPFIDERHYRNTVEDGSWPIRALYAAPPICPTAEGQLILGKNYEAGLWSRRNYEAMLEDQLAAAPEYKKP